MKRVPTPTSKRKQAKKLCHRLSKGKVMLPAAYLKIAALHKVNPDYFVRFALESFAAGYNGRGFLLITDEPLPDEAFDCGKGEA